MRLRPCCKTGRHLSNLQCWYFEAKKAAAQTVKCPKNTTLGRSLIVGWFITVHLQTKYFGRPFAAYVKKAEVPQPPSRTQLETFLGMKRKSFLDE